MSRERYLKQKSASRIMWSAINSGFIRNRIGEPCSDCGKNSEHHEHRDYNKPLDVEPVCHSCNLRRGSAAPFQDLPRKYDGKYAPIKTNKHPMRGFSASMLEITTEPFE